MADFAVVAMQVTFAAYLNYAMHQSERTTKWRPSLTFRLHISPYLSSVVLRESFIPLTEQCSGTHHAVSNIDGLGYQQIKLY